MRLFGLLLASASLLFPGAGSAAARKVQATNGVAVTVVGDEFKPFTDYSAPAINGPQDGGGLGFGGYLYAVRKPAGMPPVHMVQGAISYSGNWRMYDHAYLRGGEVVEFTSLGREVGSCRSSCTLSESYALVFTPEQVARAVAGDGLVVQLVARGGGNELILNVPKDQIVAVEEVSSAGAKAAP